MQTIEQLKKSVEQLRVEIQSVKKEIIELRQWLAIMEEEDTDTDLEDMESSDEEDTLPRKRITNVNATIIKKEKQQGSVGG